MAKIPSTAGAGRRDRLIVFVEQVHGSGGSGFPTVTDGERYQMFASKDDVSGLEQMAAGQPTAPFTTRWEVVYRPELDPERVDVPKTFVIDYAGRRYDITSASMIGRRAGVEMTTLARQG